MTQQQSYELFEIVTDLIFKQDYHTVTIEIEVLENGKHVRNNITGLSLPTDEARKMKLSTYIIDNLPYNNMKTVTSINIDPINKSITFKRYYNL